MTGNSTKNKHYRYVAFGMNVQSEVFMRELLPLMGTDDTRASCFDMEVVIASLDEEWKQWGPADDYYAVRGGRFLMHVPELALFGVEDGRRIMVSPIGETDPQSDLVRLYILGTCFGILLMQRGILPLHGSAVVIDGKAYAFLGDSGAGKSTTAAALLERGGRLLTDDVVAIAYGPNEELPAVIPGYPQQKLWQESLERLGRNPSEYATIYETKHAVPVLASYCGESIPLAAIFELKPTEDDSETSIRLERRQGFESLPDLMRHTFRSPLVPMLGLEAWHFSAVARLAGAIGIFRLRRPLSGFTARQVVDRVFQALSEEA